MNAATALGRLVVDELVRAGVRDAVLAPGSRSAPLALALHEADRSGRLTLHVRIDERSAGFLALGLSRGSHRPVPVVTTSGSAVANLHPAVLEAHHSGVPLLVVSADRPAELRGTGANQTTHQVGLFGDAVRGCVDVPAGALPDPAAPGFEPAVAAWRAQVCRLVAAATGAISGDPGPVQLNCCFAPPLVPDEDDGGSVPPGRPDGQPWTTVVDPAHTPPAAAVMLERGPRTLVVAGADAGSPARLLAEQSGWPLVAEPTSGARTGDNALLTGSRLLGHPPLAADVQRVVVAGRPTLSRPVTALLSRSDVELVVLAAGPRWSDPGNRAGTVARAVATPEGATRDEEAWLRRWLDADRRVSAEVDRVLATAAGRLPAGVLLGPDVAREVAAALPPYGLLVVASSSPVRDLDMVVAPYPVGGRRLVLANRGLSGIDGTVSTAVGAALGRRSSSRSFALVGDLAFCHDTGGLLAGPAEPRPDLTVVVANDDGGSIFTTLEPGADRFAAGFERLFGTPTGTDLAALCAASGTSHREVSDLGRLRAELARPEPGLRVLEATIDRTGRRELHRQLDAAVAEALAGKPTGPPAGGAHG